MNPIPVQQGETLVMHCVHKVGGVATSIAGMTITSSVKTKTNYGIQDLTFAAGVGTGEFTLTATDEQTANWPTGVLYWDIRIEAAGEVMISNRGEIHVSRPVTTE